MQTRSLDQKLSAVILGGGEIFPDTLQRFAAEKCIFGASFTAIGAFSRVTLGYFNLDSNEYEKNVLNEQVEVASLIGNIGVFNDETKIHAHVVVGRRDGTAFAGHLIEGVVRPTLEIFVYDSNMRITRQLDAATGLPLIHFLSKETG